MFISIISINTRSWIKQIGSHPCGPYILSYKHIFKSVNSLVTRKKQIKTKRYRVAPTKSYKVPHVVKGQEKRTLILWWWEDKLVKDCFWREGNLEYIYKKISLSQSSYTWGFMLREWQEIQSIMKNCSDESTGTTTNCWTIIDRKTREPTKKRYPTSKDKAEAAMKQ